MNFSLTALRENLDSTNFKSVLYMAGSFATSLLIKKALEETWEKTQGTPAPKDPNDFTTSIKHVFVWTVAISLLSGLGKIAYRAYVPNPSKKLKA